MSGRFKQVLLYLLVNDQPNLGICAAVLSEPSLHNTMPITVIPISIASVLWDIAKSDQAQTDFHTCLQNAPIQNIYFNCK